MHKNILDIEILLATAGRISNTAQTSSILYFVVVEQCLTSKNIMGKKEQHTNALLQETVLTRRRRRTYLSVNPFFFHQHLVMIFAFFHRAHRAHTCTVAPAVKDKRLLMVRTELLRAIFDSVCPTRRTSNSLCRVVACHFAQNGQGHVSVQGGSRGESLFANRAVEWCVLRSTLLHLIPVFGYAYLAEGVATRDSHWVFEALQADGAGQTVLLHDQTCLLGNKMKMRLQTRQILQQGVWEVI